MKKFIEDALSLIYPQLCETCDHSLFRHENFLCNKCYINLPKTGFYRQPHNPVFTIFRGRVDVKAAHSFLFFQKKNSTQKLLHKIKYKGRPEIARLLGNWYAEELKNENHFYDYIIPVPLHQIRLQKRGYNQSLFFAEGLSEILNIPVATDILVKHTYTETQTFKSREHRFENTFQSFGIKNAPVIMNKKILLVDDVITTGATTEACISKLKQAFAGEISVASIAYTI